MTFAQPLAFWLLAALVPLAWLDRGAGGPTKALWPRITRLRANATRIEPLAGTAGNAVRWRLWLGLTLLVVALAGPQAGALRVPAGKAPREVVVALDLSRSMLARDVKPSRLDHAKLLTAALLEKAAGDRLALVLFSATAYVQLPLSNDYQIFNEMLANLSPAYFPQSGTNFAAMLAASLGAFSRADETERFLVVISDGEAFDANWSAALPEFKARGIRVITVAVGTAAGTVLATEDGPLRTATGGEVVSRLNTATLEELAAQTGGRFALGSSWLDIASLLKTPPGTKPPALAFTVDPTRLVERYQWFVVPALLLLLWSFWVELPVRPSPRTVRLPPTASSGRAREIPRSAAVATAAVLVALVCSAPPSSHSQDVAEQREESDGSEGTPTRSLASLVSQRISAMLAKPAPDANDCVSLVIDIVAYCENTLRARQRFPVSIIDDAQKAVDLGERLDPKGGDWPKLRKDLQGLLGAVNAPWKTARPDAARTTEITAGYDPASEMKEDKLSAGLRASDPTDEAELATAKSSFAENSAFGAMGGQPAAPREPETPPVASDEQVIGGRKTAADEEREEHPELVLPLQKLEHVRRNDTPAKLFQMLEGKAQAFVPSSPQW